MANAITYKDIFLSLPGVLHLKKLVIQENVGYHIVMSLQAIMNAELDDYAFYDLPETISLNYFQNNQEKILFKGVISSAVLKKDGGNRIIEIVASDATYWMDIDRKTRCFQNIEKTVSEVIAEIMKGYGESDSLCNIPDRPIGELIFQYEETDWEFLKRFLSKYNESLYPAATFETIHFQAGIATQNEDVNWDYYPYQKNKDFSRLAYLSKNGFTELLPAQFTFYRLENHDVVALGSQIRYKGNLLYVSRIKRELNNGLLVNTYELKQKEAMLIERFYNSRLTGISQYATVVNTQRDRVQVVMQKDLIAESCYWYPFSSVSSSSDGSGWYCMPEKGESVRVYFPTENESEAYVITCVKGHAPAGEQDPMGNPSVRSISTDAGNLVQFNDDGILIEAKTGDASISLKNSGEIIVSGPLKIDLSPTTSCSLSAKTINCETSGLVKVIDDSGVNITAGTAGVFLNAKEIHEN